jgi:hypothetical protein
MLLEGASVAYEEEHVVDGRDEETAPVMKL